MDPFTAVSLAGNILQFIGTARSIYKQVADIRSSVAGLTQKNEEMLASAAQLNEIAEGISAGIRTFHETMTPTEKRIRDVGARCQQLARELEEEIRTKAMKDRSNLIRATTSVIMGSWKISEADKKLKELNDLQKALYKLVLAHISGQQARLGMTMTRLLEQNRRLEMNRAEELQQLKSEILAATESLKPLIKIQGSESSAKEIGFMLLSWVEQATFLKREQKIIQSLRFDGMLHRRDEIPTAHNNTFEWAFEPKLHLKEWLETGQGIYWISGDPGSGKSTLIKHLSGHATTHQALTKWAEDKTLITAKFFFWFSGTRLQKSQEGLLRSLLFEIFRQCPSAIPTACPSRWSSELTHPWERDELMEAIGMISLQMPSTRFCFFIDGLDEYRGEPGVEHGNDVPSHVSEIIHIMDKLSKLEDVKICISSRPWRAFERAFGGASHRKLYVNNENGDDIRSYIRDRLENSDAFADSSYNNADLQSLVEEMVADSRGIFIWVFLVVESLLRGLSNEDRIAELRRRLNETPKTLNDLFERMLNSIEEIYQEQAAQILQVALHAVEPMYVVVYSFIGDSEYDVFKAEIRPWTAEECLSVSKTAAVRISVRCPDLIKIRNPKFTPTKTQEMMNHQVDFLHRTVRDFLALEDTQQRLNRRLKRPFDPGMFICNGLLAQVKGASVAAGNWQFATEDLFTLLDNICLYVEKLEERTGQPQISLLDELERVIAHQTGQNEFFLGGIDSFLGTMVRKNLYLYVEQKLAQGINSHGVPLLNCALFNEVSGKNLSSPKMVSLLLRHGAKPDEDGEGGATSIWYSYMRRLHRKSQDDSFRMDQRSRDVHIAIIQDLLEHGADPTIAVRATIGSGKGSTDLVEILQSAFSLEESAFLVALVKERRKAYSTNHSILGWLGWKR